MGTELYAQVEVLWPATRYKTSGWEEVSKWELNKYYELSMALEDFKKHMPYDQRRSIAGMTEEEQDIITRVQEFSYQDLRLATCKLTGPWPSLQSLLASIQPLVLSFGNDRVRVIFWRDQ